MPGSSGMGPDIAGEAWVLQMAWWKSPKRAVAEDISGPLQDLMGTDGHTSRGRTVSLGRGLETAGGSDLVSPEDP